MRLLEKVRGAPRRATVAGLAVTGCLLLAAPALAASLPDGGQPPAGSPGVTISPDEVAPIPAQPPAGANEVAVKPGDVAAVPAQPANPNPQSAGAPTQVQGPQEKPGPVRHDGGRTDGGGSGADAPGGRSD